MAHAAWGPWLPKLSTLEWLGASSLDSGEFARVVPSDDLVVKFPSAKTFKKQWPRGLQGGPQDPRCPHCAKPLGDASAESVGDAAHAGATPESKAASDEPTGLQEEASCGPQQPGLEAHTDDLSKSERRLQRLRRGVRPISMAAFLHFHGLDDCSPASTPGHVVVNRPPAEGTPDQEEPAAEEKPDQEELPAEEPPAEEPPAEEKADQEELAVE